MPDNLDILVLVFPGNPQELSQLTLNRMNKFPLSIFKKIKTFEFVSSQFEKSPPPGYPRDQC